MNITHAQEQGKWELSPSKLPIEAHLATKLEMEIRQMTSVAIVLVVSYILRSTMRGHNHNLYEKLQGCVRGLVTVILYKKTWSIMWHSEMQKGLGCSTTLTE